MKSNQFHHLSLEDQKHILKLCEDYPYEDVVEFLQLPRTEGGLALQTSPAALCRFYTSSHPETLEARGLGQYAQALRLHRQAADGATLEGILAHVETTILYNLKAGRALSDMVPEFRILKSLHKTFLEDQRARRDPAIDHQKDHRALLQTQATLPDQDFLPTSQPAPQQSPRPAQSSPSQIVKTPVIPQIPPKTSIPESRPTPKPAAPVCPPAPVDPLLAKVAPPQFKLPALNPFIEHIAIPFDPKKPVIPHFPAICALPVVATPDTITLNEEVAA